MTAGLHSTSSRGPISGRLVIALELTGMSLSIARGGQILYMPRLCVSLCASWVMNALFPHKWWSTLKSAVFGSGSDSSLPPLIGAGASLVCESVGKADMLSAHFDGKQSRDPVDLPTTCHPFPSLTTFAFRSREVKRLLLDLDSYGGTDPLGMFPLFLKRTAEVVDPRLSVVFRRLLRWVGFLFGGEWLMSPQFRKVHLPSQHAIIDQFP